MELRDIPYDHIGRWGGEENIITVSVTFGFSMMKEADTIDDLINRDDKALYQGKRSGKDKVIIAD